MSVKLSQLEKVRCELVSWQDIERWTKDVALKVKASDYRPDVIVGLARGGLVPARLLSDYLLIKDLYAVKTEHWGITATPDGRARLTQTLGADVKGRKVLLVDDITDTGQSLRLAYEHVSSLGPEEVRTATMLHISHSKFVPDYYSVLVPAEQWTWFIFPWNLYEDLRNLISRALKVAHTIKDIKAVMRESFYIDVKASLIKEVLLDLEERGIARRRGNRWELAR